MSEPKPKPQALTDESIDRIVSMVEAAEALALTFGGLKTSVAMKMMLKSVQLAAKVQNGDMSALANLIVKGNA